MAYSRKQAEHILEVFDRRAMAARQQLHRAENDLFSEIKKTNAAALEKIDKKAIKDLQKIIDDWAISNIAEPAIYNNKVMTIHKIRSELDAEINRINAERKAARAVFFPVMTKKGQTSVDLDMKFTTIEATRDKLEMHLATEGSNVTLEDYFNLAKI